MSDEQGKRETWEKQPLYPAPKQGGDLDGIAYLDINDGEAEMEWMMPESIVDRIIADHERVRVLPAVVEALRVAHEECTDETRDLIDAALAAAEAVEVEP